MRRLLVTASLLAMTVAPAVASAQGRCEEIHKNNEITGTVLGAVGGAVLGGLVAGNRGHKDSGALLGAVAGGVVGNRIGAAQQSCPEGYRYIDNVTSDLHQHEDVLAHRIGDAVNGGQLDRREGDRDYERLNRIRSQEDDMRARNGGGLSDGDRAYLNDQLNELERSIPWGAPAAPPPPRYNDWDAAPRGLHERMAWIDRRIQGEASDGDLAPEDARRLNDQLRWIHDQEYWFSQDHQGLTAEDEQNLQSQLTNLTQRFRYVVHH